MSYDAFLTPYRKIKSSLRTDLKVKAKTTVSKKKFFFNYSFQQKNTGEYPGMLGVGKGILVRTQKIITTESNNNKLEVLIIKILCSAEDIVKKIN